MRLDPPTTWIKNGVTREAVTTAEEVELRFDGWVLSGVEPEPIQYIRVARLVEGKAIPGRLKPDTLIVRTPAQPHE